VSWLGTPLERKILQGTRFYRRVGPLDDRGEDVWNFDRSNGSAESDGQGE
jgi:hypothetical protein